MPTAPSLHDFFLLFAPRKKLLDDIDVEFDFTMCHVLVIFSFL